MTAKQIPELTIDDRLEIGKLDRAALEALAEAIVDNRRLAWEIVRVWLGRHGYLLIPANSERD